MAKSKRTEILNTFTNIVKRLEEQENFARYEFMERPEIAPYAKGAAVSFHTAALMVQLALKEIETKWPDKTKKI